MCGKQHPQAAIPRKDGISTGRYLANASLFAALSMQSENSYNRLRLHETRDMLVTNKFVKPKSL